MCAIRLTGGSVLYSIYGFVILSVDLLSLLQWKEHPEMIQEALNRVLRLNGEELVKFLQDVLDALFSMFSTEDGNSTTHSGLVFHVLVSYTVLEASLSFCKKCD
jgi:dedicator of cytokinesis protein 3